MPSGLLWSQINFTCIRCPVIIGMMLNTLNDRAMVTVIITFKLYLRLTESLGYVQGYL